MSRINSENISLGDSFVIKIDSGAHSHSGKLQRAIEENQVKAKSIIEQANQEAQKIIEEAKQAAVLEAQNAVNQAKEEARENGHQEGYEAGYQDGMNALTTEISREVVLFNNFVENSFEIKKRILKSAHLEIVKMVSEIADKICHKKLALDEEVLYEITSAALDMLKEKEIVTIIVHPSMKDAVFGFIDKIKEENSLISTVKIVEDISVSPDGTVVEALSGRIDARISSQIEEITNRLLAQIQSTSDDELINEVNSLAVETEDAAFTDVDSETGEQNDDAL